MKSGKLSTRDCDYFFWVHHNRVYLFFRVVSGFGVTGTDGRRMLTNKLKYVQLPLVDQETCTRSIALTRQSNPNCTKPDTQHVLCWSPWRREGTPAKVTVKAPMPWLTMDGFGLQGLSAGGLAVDCRDHMESDTRVTNYLDWITKTMQENWEPQHLKLNKCCSK